MSGIDRFEKKQGVYAEAGRVLDITDERWGHPEVRDPWAVPADDPSLNLYNPDFPLEQKREMGPGFQKMLDDMFDAQEHTCKIDKYVVSGCPEEPDTEAEVYVFTPNNLKREKNNPCLFNVPGGALAMYCAYSVPMDWLCEQLQAVGVMVRYRLSWEATYPAAINDIHAAYAWMVDNAEMLGINPDKVVIHGSSSGGHLSLAAGFRLKRYGFKPRGIVVTVPQTDDRLGEEEAIYSGVWDTFAQQDAMHSWLGNRTYSSAAVGPEALPNRATVEDCKGFPPCFIHTGELDPDADANRSFYAKVKRAHSYCEYHAWGGSMHTNNTWRSFSGIGEESEYNKLVEAVAMKNMRDCLKYDLRRDWLGEE